MTKIINNKGKNIKAKYLPKFYCGDRLPYIENDTVTVGKSHPKSIWNTYTLQDILENDCGVLVYDGSTLRKVD